MVMRALAIPATSLAHSALTGVTVAQHHTATALYTDPLAVAAVEAEATLALAGSVDVATGQVLSADGLLFPDTMVPSADVNMLDDYEEGTWTPGIADDNNDGSGEGQAYSVQVGFYTKIGRIVELDGEIAITDLGSLTVGQDCRIVGLPFTAHASQEDCIYISRGTSLALNNAGENVTGFVSSGATDIRLTVWDAVTGTTDFLISELSVGGRLRFSGRYRT